MDRKNDNILTQIKRNDEALEEFKSTQMSGSDSVLIQLVTAGDDWNTSAVMAPDSRWVFYYQVFNSEAMNPEDAGYDSGVVNIYVDIIPPTETRYMGIKSTNLSTGFSNPILFIGSNTIEYENSLYWSVTLRNIDSVNHTVYTKGYCNTTMNPGALFWGWGAVES